MCPIDGVLDAFSTCSRFVEKVLKVFVKILRFLELFESYLEHFGDCPDRLLKAFLGLL